MKGPKLGIEVVPKTYSVCKMVWTDKDEHNFMSFDALITSDWSGETVHLALPVEGLEPQTPLFAGKMVPRPFEEFAQGFQDLGQQHGLQVECAEGLSLEELPQFLLDPIWAAGAQGKDLEETWSAIQRILTRILGAL